MPRASAWEGFDWKRDRVVHHGMAGFVELWSGGGPSLALEQPLTCSV